MIKKFLKKSIKFQIITLVIVSILVPSVIIGGIYLGDKVKEKNIINERRDNLIQTAKYLEGFLTDKNLKNIKNDDSYLKSLVKDKAMPIEGSPFINRMSVYVVENNKVLNLDTKKQDSGIKDFSKNINNYLNKVIESKKDVIEENSSPRIRGILYFHPVIKNGSIAAIIEGEAMIPSDILFGKYNSAFLIFSLLLFLMFILILAVLIIKGILENVKEVTIGLDKIESDLDNRIPVLNGEFNKISSSINNMAEGLKEKEEMEKKLQDAEKMSSLLQLVSGIAHEIRNPLGIIRGTVQVMKDEFKEVPGIDEYIDVLLMQCDRQNKVVGELLDYAKESRLQLMDVNLNQIVKSVINLTSPYIRKNKVLLKQELNVIPEVKIDPDKLKQVFINIIINSCEAAKEKGQLEITTYYENGLIKISFKDDGKGMKKEELDKIFNPYFTTKQNGTGLGLAISKKLSQDMEGTIEIKSSENVGTEAVITFKEAGGGKSV
ncbi:MAG: ATP-binding protein [Clostridiaceae bacterium]